MRRDLASTDAPRPRAVTGASARIGRAIASRWRRGLRLALGYLRRKSEADRWREIADWGARQSFVLRLADRKRRGGDRLPTSRAGRLWGAVSNGRLSDGPFAGLSGEAWDRVLRTTWTASTRVGSCCSRWFASARGRIVT